MKCLLITTQFMPEIGGSLVIYYSLCKRFPKDEIVVLTSKVKGCKAFDKLQKFKIKRSSVLNIFTVQKEGLPIKYTTLIYYGSSVVSQFLRRITQIVASFSILLECIYIVLKQKVDVILCGQVWIPGGLISVFLKLILRKPYVCFVYGEDLAIVSRNSKLKEKLLKVILDNSFKIIAMSNYTESQINKFQIPENKIIKIPGAVDMNIVKVNQAEKRNLVKKLNLENRCILLSVCRLVERKGIDMVIKALPKVIEKIPELTYLIVGDGPERAKLKGLSSRLNLGKYVKFIGSVPADKVPLFYSLADLFVMPNREIEETGDNEGFGLVFLEANAFGIPVIGGRSGGTIDAIVDKKTGFLVNPVDVEEISKSIIMLLENKELAKKLGQDGKERVRREYTWDANFKILKDALIWE